MNPATDVGKRDLPAALKHRFTEIYAGECEGREDLALLVSGGLSSVPGAPVDAVVDFYLAARQEATATLLDSADQKPQYSLRTLSRAMEYVRAAAPIYGVQRALYDGFAMSFHTLLKAESGVVLERLMVKHLLRGTPLKVRREHFLWILFSRRSATRGCFFFLGPKRPKGHPSSPRGLCGLVAVLIGVVESTVGAHTYSRRDRTEKCGFVNAREERLRTLFIPFDVRLRAARLPLDPRAKHRTVRGLTLSKRLCCVAPQAIFKAPPAPPGDTHELIERYWVEAGDLDRVDPEAEGRYVVTPGSRPTSPRSLARGAAAQTSHLTPGTHVQRQDESGGVPGGSARAQVHAHQQSRAHGFAGVSRVVRHGRERCASTLEAA